MDTPVAAPRAGRKEWIGLAVLALPCLLYSMDLTVLHLAVPQLSADLKPTSAQLLWIVDIYGFLVAGSLITMGTLGDRIGRRKLLMIGGAAFGCGSILAGFSTSAEMLIVARALLGVAAATLAPSTLSLLRNMFHDPKERAFAISIWISSYSAGGIIGPLIGGTLLAFFPWGSVFLINVPVMILLLTLAPILLPEFRDPNAGRLDIVSAVQSLAAVLLVIFGIKWIAEGGSLWIAAATIVVGGLVAMVFIRRQGRLTDPLIDLNLFRRPAFSGALVVNVLGLFVMFGTFLFVAQYLQLVMGLTPLHAGVLNIPSGVGFVVGSMLGPALAHRYGTRTVIAAGLVIAAAGFACFGLLGGPHDVALVLTAFIIFSIGLGPVFALTTDVVVGAAPPERAGSAAAISETGAEFGGALGIAVLGSLVTAIYRGGMADTVPAGVPAETADAVRDTLGGAAAVLADLPTETAAGLLAAARDTFTSGVVAASLSAAALAVAAAMVTLAIFPRGTTPGGGH